MMNNVTSSPTSTQAVDQLGDHVTSLRRLTVDLLLGGFFFFFGAACQSRSCC